MAVLMMLEVPGATIEQYEATARALGHREADFDLPAGLISHTAGPTEDGILIVDVWESPEKLERFLGELGPVAAENGISGVEPRILPVHALIREGRGERAGVMIVIEVDGFGTDAYDRMVTEMPEHAADGSDHPAVSHVAATSDGGMVVVDVWESPEAFGAFAQERVAPAGEAVGLGPIEPRLVPVHHRMAAKS